MYENAQHCSEAKITVGMIFCILLEEDPHCV